MYVNAALGVVIALLFAYVFRNRTADSLFPFHLSLETFEVMVHYSGTDLRERFCFVVVLERAPKARTEFISRQVQCAGGVSIPIVINYIL
ncbi:hypothetical protein CDAR_543491 [Caerostris darwini]|uniref:Uncharacterized protein n=1 Tax=Caerostris darwini TaxID=1538125 RepID=A0AAV4PCW5_9ARAC|nr:hypothetical protein CDAR_543491 [Caerostris darwini]